MGLTHRQKILLYLHVQPTAPRYTPFVEDLILNKLYGKMNSENFHNTLTQLRDEGLVKRDKDKENHNRYFLTDKGTAEVMNLINDKKFDKEIDLMTGDEAKQMLKELLHASVE